MKYLIIFLSLLLVPTSCQGQKTVEQHLGGWSGELPVTDAFVFNILLKKIGESNYNVTFKGRQRSLTLPLEAEKNGTLKARYGQQLSFHLHLETGKPTAFIETGNHLSYINFAPGVKDEWSATWNLFTNTEFDPTFYLSLDRQGDTSFYASTFFQAPAMHYMLGQDFEASEEEFSFRDARSGINFTGRLKADRIDLTMAFLLERMNIVLRRTDYSQWAIGQPDSSITVSYTPSSEEDRFSRLTADILSDTLERTHAVLVRRGGETLYEQYFDGFDHTTVHDTRSATKSIAGAITGLAIEDGIILDEYQRIRPYLEADYPGIDWSANKSEITIFHLLTMSSGLDAIDFGLNRMSFANEGNYQSQDDWAGYILSAPMVNNPGDHANYGSGNPHLLGPILSKASGKELPFYLHERLLGPLGFKNYRLQIDDKGQPYFGGGWYLTARDLASFGQLYLNQGKWNDNQLLSETWCRKSMQKHLILENTIDQNPYGYYFWHKTYRVGNREIASVEARGNGGQYVFIVPEYDLVVVILSGNYQNNKGFQPERIMLSYILPQIK